MLDTVRILSTKISRQSCRQSCKSLRHSNCNISTNKQERKSLFEFRKNLLFHSRFLYSILIVLFLLPLLFTRQNHCNLIGQQKYSFFINNIHEKISRFWLAKRSAILRKYSANFFYCLLANHVRPYSKILKDGNLLDKTNKHGGGILKDILIIFLIF